MANTAVFLHIIGYTRYCFKPLRANQACKSGFLVKIRLSINRVLPNFAAASITSTLSAVIMSLDTFSSLQAYLRVT
jgi:hypothetical protein